ncbi:MAG: glycosyl hydrolase family 8 [Chitinivibrionia bacterium]|nr:glycosyl hydrolase family 8 [Chitinivibrionia bacterium]
MKLKAVATIMLSAFVAMPILAQNFPFPQASNYDGRTIKPERDQSQMNQDVITKYNAYKTAYLRNEGQYYYIKATGSANYAKNSLTVSEAHGYGMIIFALMAGHDPQAKTIFDGMNQLRKAHGASGGGGRNNLMTWYINTIGQVDPNYGGPATDGDLDNAYALILAYNQWGDQQYLNDAKTLINAIKSIEMHTSVYRTNLGGYGDNLASRSSDWMPGHFRTFAAATGDNFWTQAADNVYTLIGQVSNSQTGLIPDFVKGNPATPDYGCGSAEGEEHCESYYYNACRDPWRLALDYAHWGTPAAKTQIDKISTWLRGVTGGNGSNIKSGFNLNGNVIGDYFDIVFAAPFAAGMIANSANQSFLNSTYNTIRNTSTNNAYEAALQLLSMLLITGNWSSASGEGGVGGGNIGGNTDIELSDYSMADWSINIDPEDGNPQDFDGYGSWARIDENNTETGVLRLSMNVAAGDDEDEIYPWASIGTYFDAGEFPATATKFLITYTSSAPIMITFEEPPVKVGGKDVEGYARGFELPAQTTEKTIEVYISGFEYPDWGDEYPKPALDKSKIAGIMIEAIPQEGRSHTVSATFKAFKVISSSGGTSISFEKTKPTQQRGGLAGISVSQRNINLNIPSEKSVAVKISDVRGRLLYGKDVTLNSGVATLNIPSSIAKSQMLILNVSGKNGLNVSQKILLK